MGFRIDRIVFHLKQLLPISINKAKVLTIYIPYRVFSVYFTTPGAKYIICYTEYFQKDANSLEILIILTQYESSIPNINPTQVYYFICNLQTGHYKKLQIKYYTIILQSCSVPILICYRSAL